MKFLIILIIALFVASMVNLIAKRISHKKKQKQELTKEEQEEAEKKEYRQLCAEIREHPNELKRMLIGVLAVSILLPSIIGVTDPEHFHIETFDFKAFTAMFIVCALTSVIILVRDEGLIIVKRQKKLEYELSHAQDKVEEDLFKNSINMSYTYLNQYYEQTREQAKSGFFVTVAVAIFGAILIFGGVGFLLFGNSENVTPAYITCASGAITEFISAVFFYLYNKTIMSMNSYHDKLVLSQNISFALRVADSLSEDKKDDAKLAIISELVKDVNAQMMKSDGDADESPKKDKPPASDAETPS